MSYPGAAIVNPPTPFCGGIPGGLTNGKMVYIQGVISDTGTFSVNLSCSSSPDLTGDVALHFNPRCTEQRVVRNTLQNGGWGQEEASGGFPFHKGQPFELIFLVEQDQFKVAVNGKHFTGFRHRIPKDRAQFLVIKGSIKISFIRFDGGTDMAAAKPPPAAPPPQAGMYFPGGFSGQPPAGAYPGHGAAGAVGGPYFNPPVPYTTNIPGNIYPGKMIFISGVPHNGASRFHFNLQCGAHDGADIALHFDVRFNFGDSHNVVVRNHLQGGQFGNEERHANYFPFFQNANFDIIILVEPGSFKVAVNNQHFMEFLHRMQPLSRIDTLKVDGDVKLTQVRFQ